MTASLNLPHVKTFHNYDKPIFDQDAVKKPKAAPGAPDPTKGTSTLGKEDKERFNFLRLLTIQAEHQDPQNPMEMSEMGNQIALLSSLEEHIQNE